MEFADLRIPERQVDSLINGELLFDMIRNIGESERIHFEIVECLVCIENPLSRRDETKRNRCETSGRLVFTRNCIGIGIIFRSAGVIDRVLRRSDDNR